MAAIIGALAGAPALAADKAKQGYLPPNSFDSRAVPPTAAPQPAVVSPAK